PAAARDRRRETLRCRHRRQRAAISPRSPGNEASGNDAGASGRGEGAADAGCGKTQARGFRRADRPRPPFQHGCVAPRAESGEASVIGLFDSGYGGLTILRALHTRLPNQRFLYLGDNAHAPYGAKSAAEIEALTRSGVERLFALGARLVIIACNTATAVALRPLQQAWLPAHHPERRILGVIA